MNKFTRSYGWLMLLLLTAGSWALAPQAVEARSFTYPSYDVDIQINADSTVDVTETATYRFEGEYRGVSRSITLEDRAADNYCRSSGRTCGGFERIALLGVYDQQNRPVTDYELAEEENEDTGDRFYVIKWTVWPGGKMHDGSETFAWTVKYRLYGSLGWVGSSEETADPYFYWDALPEDRGGFTDVARVTVSLPTGTTADRDSVEVFADSPTVTASGNKFVVSAKDLPPSSFFTIAYQLPQESVNRPARLSFSSTLPWTGVRLKLDGVDLGNVNGVLQNFPVGTHSLKFYFPGYESKVVEVTASSGEVITLDATLVPSAGMQALITASGILNIIGIIQIPLALLWVYRRWNLKGRDESKQATIIPLFTPPAGTSPYLVGSVVDERVDKQDVTGTIIDLAYRGYVKIKEITKGKNYELTRLEGKKGDPGLNAIEQEVLDGLFGTDTVVETKDLAGAFALKYVLISQKIYREMVEHGYFRRSPQTTRGIYFGAGIGLMMVGIVAAGVLGIGGLFVIGVLGPITMGIALAVLGVALTVVATHMPAKTALGSKLHAQILGFKMYLHTAERYRLQNLEPEDFERYLSYAIVFGIEKQWADKFKDIYKQKPDWYEGDTNMMWNAYWVSSFARSFSDNISTTVFTSQSGSSSGSGWSGGGGSFGGFGGGGGGGGGSGGF